MMKELHKKKQVGVCVSGKEMLQEILPYSMYGFFAWIIIDGFPSLYFFGSGEYFSNRFLLPVYFIFCLTLAVGFEKNKAAGKFKWLRSVVSALIIESFFFLLFAQYFFVAAVVLLIAIISSGIIINGIMKAQRPRNKQTYRFLKSCHNRTKIICAYISVLIMIVPSIIGAYKEYVDVFSVKDWNALFQVLTTEENKLLSDSKEILIPELARWEELSLEERFQAICKVGILEEKHLGIENPDEIELSYGKFNKNKLAYYSDTEKTIRINVDELNTGSVQENIDSIIHEVFHAYQHYIISTLDFESSLVKTSFYYADARAWKENMENYISGQTDYLAYEAQPLEADARRYAEQRAQIYLDFL